MNHIVETIRTSGQYNRGRLRTTKVRLFGTFSPNLSHLTVWS